MNKIWVILAMCVLCYSTAFGADRNRVGINVHAFDGAEGSSAAIRAAESGIGWVRVDFNWYAMEPGQNQFDWASTDATIDNAYNNGLNVLATLGYSPSWSRPGTTPGDSHLPPDDAHMPDWENFVKQVVIRYGARVKYLSIWNEPNAEYWEGTTAQYDQLFAVASKAIKATNSTVQVVGFENGYAPGEPNDSWICGRLAAAQNNGAAVDVIAVHNYGTADETENALRNLGMKIGTSRPIWLTETGEPVDYPYLIDQERDIIGKVGLINRGIPALDKVFYYDFSSDIRGIVSPTWPFKRKPAFNALKFFMQGSYQDWTSMNRCTGVNGLTCTNACNTYEYSCSADEGQCFICP